MTPRAVVVEEVEHFLGFGDQPRRIATVLGMRPTSVARALYRAGRPDLANPFERARDTARAPRKPRPTHPCSDCGGPAYAYATRCRSCSAKNRERMRRFAAA